MSKHAYLIIAHNNFELLEKLLVLLDDERNDIYVHIDKKVKDFDPKRYFSVVKKGTLTFTKRINVNWGGFSQIKAEMLLLKEATKKVHTYYHLLSGVDLPLKTQNLIHEFFCQHKGENFVGVDNDTCSDPELLERVRYYRLFQDVVGRNTGSIYGILERIESVLVSVQKKLNVNREVNNVFYKGSSWFSITHSAATYVVGKEKEIKSRFNYTICCDELFLQTVLKESPYSNTIVGDYIRHIDWKRGNPYIYTIGDFQELSSSDKLFARKFDYVHHPKIVDALFDKLNQTQKDTNHV